MGATPPGRGQDAWDGPALHHRVRAFLAWCQRTGHGATLDRATVAAFVADLLDSGREAATARARHLALRRFAAWLVDEGELEADPLDGMKPPKLDSKVIPILSDPQLRALIAACEGKTLRDRRDEALVRLLAETGLRPGEAVALTVDDVDLAAGTLVVRRGKGGKGRLVPFGPQTGRALDRYLRLRRQHRLAATPSLWVGTAVGASAMTRCTSPSLAGPGRRASGGSPHTCSGTRPRHAGWLAAAAKAA